MSEQADKRFNPEQHLIRLDGRGGALYLPVQWRLAWFRAEHPDGQVTTDLIAHNPNEGYAMFRAEARTPSGGVATGHGDEHRATFAEYVTKAETVAIGRALAALGYGTQYAVEMSDVEGGKIADAPVGGERVGGHTSGGGRGMESLATDRQIKFLYAIAGELGWNPGDVDRYLEEQGFNPEMLTRRDASRAIELLQTKRGQGEAAPARSAPPGDDGPDLPPHPRSSKARRAATTADPLDANPVTSATEFWTWARGAGFRDAAAIEEITGMRPGAAGVDLAVVQAALIESMSKRGNDGEFDNVPF